MDTEPVKALVGVEESVLELYSNYMKDRLSMGASVRIFSPLRKT